MEVGVVGATDGGVKTARAFGRGDHVPQTDSCGQERREPRLIGEGRQIGPDHPADQRPEAVSRMGVILFGRKRGDPGEGAEDEQAGSTVDNSGKGLGAGGRRGVQFCILSLSGTVIGLPSGLDPSDMVNR